MDNKILTELPRHTNGRCKGKIDWVKTINMNVILLYKNCEYKVKILKIENNKLTIQYNNSINIIAISNFYTCNVGNILGLKTSNFYYKNNDIVKTNSGKIRILNNIYIKRKNDNKDKGYIVECLSCKYTNGDSYIYKVRETDLKNGIGCPCCSNTHVEEGINDIFTTHPYLLKYFVDIKDSKKYSYGNANKIKCKCPICGTVKLISPNTLIRHGLGCVCYDGFSYPSKFIFNILKQLKIEFVTEYSPKWITPKRYDFYFKYNNKEYIVETNGLQHYDKGFSKLNGRTLEEEQNNDKYKKELALQNYIKEDNYIVIDCSKSELEYIKNNILNSKLNDIFDLSKIDWNKCEEFALSNRVKEACDLWSSGIESTKEIGNIMNINRNTACRYLKQGTVISWCDYDPKEESIKNKCKKIICKENGVIFKSIVDCSKQSIDIFGVEMNSAGICAVCNGKYKKYKGYSFEYYIPAEIADRM